MQFSDSVTKNGLVEDIDFLCGTTSASYPLVDKTRNINQAYHDVARLIWEVADGWQYDDSNKTDLPIATTNLVHSQPDYELPSTCQRVQRVEVLDVDGDWRVLKQIDIHDLSVAVGEYLETDGLPTHYDLYGRSLELFPEPSSAYVTLTNGLKVFFDRDVTEFTTASTTAEPGFAKPFHRILSLSASLDFEKDPYQRRVFQQMKDRLEQGLKRFYGHRNIQRRAAIRPYGRRYRYEYE